MRYILIVLFSVIFTFNSYASDKWFFIDEGWNGAKFYVYNDKDKIKKDGIFLYLYHAVNYKKCNGTKNYPCSALLYTKFNCSNFTSLDLNFKFYTKHNFGGILVNEKNIDENIDNTWDSWNDGDTNYIIMKKFCY